MAFCCIILLFIFPKIQAKENAIFLEPKVPPSSLFCRPKLTKKFGDGKTDENGLNFRQR